MRPLIGLGHKNGRFQGIYSDSNPVPNFFKTFKLKGRKNIYAVDTFKLNGMNLQRLISSQGLSKALTNDHLKRRKFDFLCSSTIEMFQT